MFQNNNGEVVKQLSERSFKSNKIRNCLIGGIIILATFLLTFTSTFGYNASMELKNRTQFQAMFENVSMDVMEKIRLNPNIKNYGISQKVGKVKSENSNLFLSCSDENTMKMFGISIKTGRMPESPNQIVIEKDYLDSIHADLKIGSKLTLNYRNDASKKMCIKDFIITGFLETEAKNDMNRSSYSAIVSKAFIDSDPALFLVNPSVAIEVRDAKQYSNEELKEKIKEIAKAVGLLEQSVRINNMNIDSNNTSAETSFFIAVVALLVVVACSLVIYNIFYVSIIRKVKEYGQLRTIGTTRKQIKKLIFREGKILSMKYIPIGIFMGCIASYIIRPSMWLIMPSMILAFFAGLIIFLTVMFSVRKPAKMAASVSPIEAVAYTGYQLEHKKTKYTSKKLTPKYLGIMNLTRNKRKTVVTFLSLILSGILFIVAASLLTSVDPDARAKQEFPYGGEYSIELNRDLLSTTMKYSDLQINNPLSDELKADILHINGVDKVETHKYIRSEVMNVNTDDNSVGIDNIRDKDIKEFEKFLVEGYLPVPWDDSSPILVNRVKTYKYLGVVYGVGDKITMNLHDGKTQSKKEFTVVGIIDNKDNGTTFFLPDKAMDDLMMENCNISYEVISKQGYSAEVESELRGLIASEDRLDIMTLKEEISIYRSAFHTVAITIYAFVALISCFGIVNLINTIITNVISRKNEIGILQAVGLSKNQLTKMLNTENAYLIFGSFTISIFLGGILGYFVCKVIENMAGFSFVAYQFPIGIIALYFLMVSVIQFTLTRFVASFMQKKSTIEWIREI